MQFGSPELQDAVSAPRHDLTTATIGQAQNLQFFLSHKYKLMISNTSYACYKREVTGLVLGLTYVAWLTPSVFGNFKNAWAQSKRCTGS